jgi:hypothetical protein
MKFKFARSRAEPRRGLLLVSDGYNRATAVCTEGGRADFKKILRMGIKRGET